MENQKEKENEVEKIIRDMKQTKCSWHGCTEKMHIMLSVFVVEKNGEEFKRKSSIAIATPFCMYHAGIAVSGTVAAEEDPKTGKFKLVAPYDEVVLIENVIASMVISGKFAEMQRQREKNPIRDRIKNKYRKRPE